MLDLHIPLPPAASAPASRGNGRNIPRLNKTEEERRTKEQRVHFPAAEMTKHRGGGEENSVLDKRTRPTTNICHPSLEAFGLGHVFTGAETA